MIRTLLLAAVALVLAALAAASASAQGVTTAALEGRVVDAATGEGLPGATVVAVHEPSGTRYGAATRADGRYDLPGLRVGGPYTVTASFVGFRTATRGDVTLSLGQAQAVGFELSEETARLGEVEVVAEGTGAIIASSRTGAATNVTEEAIQALPTLNRSLADFARLSPLSSGGGSSSPTGSSFAGRNNRYNDIQVDGATLNDVFGLAASGTPGGQASTQPISIDAIEELNVNVAPFDVRNSGFTGAQINAVTKSGTNRFEGTLRYLGRSQDLVGDLEGAEYGSAFDEQLFIGTLGGPILPDRLFFFLSAERFQNDFPEDTGVLGSGAANEFLLPVDSLQRIIGASQQTYGYDPGGFDVVTRNRDNTKVLGKLDYNLNATNRVSLRHNYVDAADDTGPARSRTAFDLAGRQYVFRSVQNSTSLQLFSTLGPRAFNEARFVFTAIRDERDPVAPFSSVRINVTGNESVFLGTNRFDQANSLDQDLFEFTDNFTYNVGQHALTFGTSNQAWRFDNLFIQDYFGTYTFGALDGTANDVVFETAPGVTTPALSAIDAFRLGLPSGYNLSYASEYAFDAQGRLVFVCPPDDEPCTQDELVPTRVLSADPQPRAVFTAFQVGLYAQDAWDVTDRLRLTGGLRLDVPLFPEEPLDNPLVAGATGVGPDGTPFEIAPAFGPEYTTTNTASGNLLFSPRLGFNYRMPGLAGLDLQLRGGTGIFSGRTPYVWISNQYANTGADFARIGTGLTPGDFDLDRDGVVALDERFFPGSADPEAQPRPGDNDALNPAQTTEINLIADGFTFPQVWRSNVGLDQQLAYGFVASLEGIYSRTLNDVTYRNLNLRQTGTAADGRPLFGGFENDAFTNALLLENTDEGYEYSLVAQLERRVRNGFGGSLAYTYNRAESVNNASSSRAVSNWQFNEAADPNAPELGTADYETRHRVLAFATYRAEYLDRLSTELSLIGDVRAGDPFSWIYNGDANGDDLDGDPSENDLIYVPAEEDEIFLTSENWALFDAFVESRDALRDARGRIATRNADRGPWRAELDLQLRQGVETLRGQRVDFELTLINVLNFLNDEWGRIRFPNFNAVEALNFERYIQPSDVGNVVAGRVVTADDLGKPVVSFDERIVRDLLTGDAFSTADLASRWQLRFGVKYTF